MNETITDSKIFKMFHDRVWPWLAPFVLVMVFLVILPLIAVIIYSFIQPTGDAIQFKSTFENYIKMFTDRGIMIALGLSIAYALIASLLCVIVGYPIAYMMGQMRSKILAKNVWVLVTLPIWISMLLKVLGLQSFFYLLSPTFLGTPIAVIVGMVYMFLPFAITPIYDSVISRNIDLEEAAMDLGCSRTKTFFTITLRETMPGILTGFSLVIVQAATSLIVVHYLGAGKITLISSIIESYFFKGANFGYGSAIAVVLTIMVFLLMLIIKAISNKFEKNGKGGKKSWRNSEKARTSQS
ncbi:ABC transporter permease [Mesoplasma lactucae ATCC 49193]|uniref:ABC transporter permease n=2 Tax=Mesoplasma lactucae TaxID=138853 RepID=A0A291ISW6_9MOLU|nr:ABC transporter permease [Mesoplasma lactucae ATCC 49193]